MGFDVCTVASNEKDAIELAKSNPPDVVVMDVYLGGTRAGIEAARWLREVCGVPIVFVTAYNDDGTLERILEVVPGAPGHRLRIARRDQCQRHLSISGLRRLPTLHVSFIC